MEGKVKKPIALLTAFMFAFTGVFMFNGVGNTVYADVGPGMEEQDFSYDKGGGALASIGIDTSKAPETYDPDSTDNPYGSDVTTMCRVSELVKIDTTDREDDRAASALYGDAAKLDGSYDTMIAKEIDGKVSGLEECAFIAGTGCDVNGAGRDSAAAIVYTNYHHYPSGSTDVDKKIYMKILNPKTNEATEPFEISSFIDNRLVMNYTIQSQLQIAAGDFDNDTVDEIAVYVPSRDGVVAPRIAIYDLTNGADCADPYQNAAWQNAWNYILPKTSAQIVACEPPESQSGTDEPANQRYYMSNFYNNIDLAAGDADNDGSCDLVVSYGASDVDLDALDKKEILRSLPSSSVLLYGSNGSGSHGGQMLKDTQELSYGDEPLIRVSIAFGDLDDDGNEEMLLGGQLQKEQGDNTSRVLGKFIYDKTNDEMDCEITQSMSIVEGSWEPDKDTGEKHFATSNGWDGYYYSLPLMKTNLAIGHLLGEQSNVRIYMDSVLYSYDDSFKIEDELEDASPLDPEKPDGEKKGSAVFTDLKGLGEKGGDYPSKDEQIGYYEYGVSASNYTASEGDYVIVHRTSQSRRKDEGPGRIITDAALLVPVENDDDEIVLTVKHDEKEFDSFVKGAPIALFDADTDIDSAVSRYTGKHDIEYSKPKIVAILASAPYFKDVADYDDDGSMLDDSQTTYGESRGNADETSSSFQFEIGLWTNNTWQIGEGVPGGAVTLVGADLNAAAGYCFTHDWGENISIEFDVNYGTSAGENAVVLMSTPIEKFEYEEVTGMIDEDGNVTTETHSKWISVPHQPATETMSMEDYMETQKRYSKTLPDLSPYITSEPGDPSSYPHDKNDMPAAVKDSWKGHDYEIEWAEKVLDDEEDKKAKAEGNKEPDPVTRDNYIFYREDTREGVGFGNGFISQTISWSKDTFDRKGNGGYGSIDGGFHNTAEYTLGAATKYDGAWGLHLGFGGDHGVSYHASRGTSFSGTVANMPRSAREYGYYFNWSLMEYMVRLDDNTTFPVVSYFVNDIQAPPKLPGTISQDHDQTTDSQIGLVWDYSEGEPSGFDVYRYKDFPQGGGDELVGTVGGSEYTIRKDSNGNTIKDSNGRAIHEYRFVETGLTADTKYNYRLKVRRSKEVPPESIFSPVIQARTDVSEKPKLSLTTDSLTIYPDQKYQLSVNLADPEHYETGIDYQWQKYSTKEHDWQDLNGCDKKILQFFNCKKGDAGEYRCRVNLVRKKESSPQYISAYTGVCKVDYSLREVSFDPISVFEEKEFGEVHTGISVTVKNTGSTSPSKPTGKVIFTLEGPNGIMELAADIDEETGLAQILNIESLLGALSKDVYFVNGGYLITARYEGDDVFSAAEDKEEYHYLRNIDECIWLSMESVYTFGKDIMPTTHLYDFRKQVDGSVLRTEITDQIKTIRLFAVDAEGKRTGEPVASFDLTDTNGTVRIPLNMALKKRAWVEAYTGDSSEAAAAQVIRTVPMSAKISISGKISGCGDLLKLYSFDADPPDVTLTGDGSFEDEITLEDGSKRKLTDLLEFKYYEANGTYICDSTEINSSPDPDKYEFIPAIYKVDVGAVSKNTQKIYETFYSFNNPKAAEFLVVGSYYEVTAASSDEGAGSVRMIAPVLMDEVDKAGFSGGAKLTLKAVPAKGFEIKSWKIQYGEEKPEFQNGGDLLTHTLRSDMTNGRNGEVSITAVFQPKNNTLTYETKGQGELSVKPAFVSGSTVLEGTELLFTAVPKPGWHFKEWRWENYGGTSSISTGTMEDSGANTKAFTMGSSPAAAYAIFFRDTIDLDLKGDLVASYINEGEDPLEDKGKEIELQKGKAAPMGAQIRVKTAPGFELAKDAKWKVTIDGESLPASEIEEFSSGEGEGCSFRLPDEVTSCQVETETEKGTYSINLSGEEVTYAVKLDGTEIPEDQQEKKLQRISSGTLVEIQALPARGKLFDHWLVDGEKQKTKASELSFTLMDNTSIEAAVKEDESHAIKLTARGEGTGLCAIKDHNGEIHEETFSTSDAEDRTVTGYKGESLTISISPEDADHTLTSVKMNGESQDLTDGTFALAEVTEDAEFICSFQPSTYYVLSFKSVAEETDPVILDGDGRPLDSGETLPVSAGGSIDFSVVADTDYPCHAINEKNEPKLIGTQPIGDGKHTRYDFRIVNVVENTEITIDDRTRYEIGSWDEFVSFLSDMDSGAVKGRPYAVLTKSIRMPQGSALTTRCHEKFKGTLDGQGFTISGVRMNYPENKPALGETSLFRSISKEGCVKNLVIEDYQSLYRDREIEDVNAILTIENYGTISGVTIKNSVVNRLGKDTQDNKCVMAGIAAYNAGTIQACQVIGLELDADRGDGTCNNAVGSAITLQNGINKDGQKTEGTVTGCYVEGLKVWINDTQGQGKVGDATESILSAKTNYENYGTFRGNYYRSADPAAEDPNGSNVTELAAAEEQDKPAFAGNLAYHINKAAGQPLWGIEDSAQTQDGGEPAAGGLVTPKIIPLDYGGKTCKAPVKADFRTEQKSISLYLWPGSYKLPGKDSFGEDTPELWMNGDVAYAPDYEPVKIEKDQTFTGVASLADGTVKLTIPGRGTACYKDPKDALAEAANCQADGVQMDIIADCETADVTFAIPETMIMAVCDGASLTMKKTASIVNKGKIVLEEGATLHKYGTIDNTGEIEVNGSFYNYGSRLKNTGDGKITGQKKIICKPHRQGDWEYAEKPNADHTWTRTSVCEVCGEETTEQIQPDPEEVDVESIALLNPPAKTEYKAGDPFSSEGMLIGAVLTDGGRAVISKYDMTISAGDPKDGKPIKDGDVLTEQGAMSITVIYGKNKTGFGIQISSAITGVAIADGQREVRKGETLQLNAVLTPPDKPAVVTWESSNESVATVDGSGLVTGHIGGQAEITVHADGSSDSCIITVHEAAESLALDREEILLLERSSDVIIASVLPGTANGEVTWTLPDTTVAGFYVKNETTGEMEITDSVTTKLVSDPQGAASAYVSLVGVGQGETVVTASIEDPQGNLIQRTCKAEVSAASAKVELLYEGEVVSGAMRTVDTSMREMQFTAESSEAGDTLHWSVIANEADPEITIDDTGKVTLLRSGIATVSVVSEKTGAGAVCILKLETKPQAIELSADSLTLEQGDQMQLEANLLPAGADGSVRWDSSNEQVARVSQNGVVAAICGGTAEITATAAADSKVTATCAVTVHEAEVSLILSSDTFYYNGRAQYPAVTVMKDDVVIAEGITKSTDQVLLHYDGGRVFPGRYIVTATLLDGSMKTMAAEYRICIKPVAIKKLIKGKNSFTVKWKKQSKLCVSGYQIRYSLKPDMSKAKKKTVRKYSKAKRTIKKLKAKKTYYVQIRTYKKINGRNCYSEWSATGKVRTR